jgi:Flp pilus assembly protein TadB
MNNLDTQQTPQQDKSGGHGAHSWMMIACCIPMLVVAIILVATGIAGIGFIFAAVMCTVMMAMMMRMM